MWVCLGCCSSDSWFNFNIAIKLSSLYFQSRWNCITKDFNWSAYLHICKEHLHKKKKLLRELSFRVHCPLTQHESRQVATRRERSVVYIISFYLLIYLLSFFQSHRELTAGKIHFCQFVTSQRMTVNVFVRGRCKVVASRGELDSSVIQVDSVCAATFEWAEWTRTSALSYNSLKRHLSVTSSGNTNIIK